MINPTEPIHVWNRSRGVVEVEKVFGGDWINLGYRTAPGRWLLSNRFFQKVLSEMVGVFQNSPLSVGQADPFIENYQIDQKKFLVPDGGFESFNDFFCRKLKPEFIQFPKDKALMGSPCEARLSVFPILGPKNQITVKGAELSVPEILGEARSDFAESLYGRGHAWVFRLCPKDYHRFHFFDDCIPGIPIRMAGGLHSVNPVALDEVKKIFETNERQVTFLKTENFGEIAFIEVGALCVGKIKQSFLPGARVRRGFEKGLFEFGASTVILLTHDSDLVPDPDILKMTLQGFETFVSIGEPVGKLAS